MIDLIADRYVSFLKSGNFLDLYTYFQRNSYPLSVIKLVNKKVNQILKEDRNNGREFSENGWSAINQ